jgi:hypothetical protein
VSVYRRLLVGLVASLICVGSWVAVVASAAFAGELSSLVEAPPSAGVTTQCRRMALHQSAAGHPYLRDERGEGR